MMGTITRSEVEAFCNEQNYACFVRALNVFYAGARVIGRAGVTR